MGKGRHASDKMYLNAKEYSEYYGGFKEKPRAEAVRRLPFDACALSQARWTDPVAAPDGSVYDITHIVPFLRRHKRNPSTGEPLSAKELVPLKWHTNGDGALSCPVSGTVFTDNSKIATIRTTGNVYSWDAVDSLMLKSKSYRDLLDDSPCTKGDILVLQDPLDPGWVAAHNVDKFWYVREKIPVDGGEGASSSAAAAVASAGGSGGAVVSAPGVGTIRMNEAARRVLADYQAADIRGFGGPAAAGAAAADAASSPSAQHVSAYGIKTAGRLAASLTSTGVGIVTRNVPAAASEDDRRAARWRGVASLGKKAFARVTTTAGPLNVELHADLVPRTVDNWLTLAKRGYFDGTTFHRVIRNFMAQTGDPSGTGRGGESAWGGKALKDEFHPRLSHSERGVLSMANSGPDSNGSQFFVLFKSAAHLDRKHSVFGRLVGGGDTLRAIETAPTGKEDRPLADIRILKVEVFADPFKEWDDSAAERGAATAAASASAGGMSGSALVGGGASIAARAQAGVSATAPAGRVVPPMSSAAATGAPRLPVAPARPAAAPVAPVSTKPAPPHGGLLSMLPPVGTGSAAAPAPAASSSASANMGVGRYMNLARTGAPVAAASAAGAAAGASSSMLAAGREDRDHADSGEPAAKRPKSGAGYGDFSGW